MITTMRRAATVLIAALIVPVLAGCAGGNMFGRAIEGCVTDDDDGRHLYVTDEGRTLILQTEGEESAGASFLVLWCVYDHLDMPEAITSRIGSTRAAGRHADRDLGRLLSVVDLPPAPAQAQDSRAKANT